MKFSAFVSIIMLFAVYTASSVNSQDEIKERIFQPVLEMLSKSCC